MPERRPDGALEAAVLELLWRADAPLTPTEVNERLGDELAYTTVMTVLARMWKKGLAERVRRGRGFAYRPAQSQSEVASKRMTEALQGVTDRASVLAGFVSGLSEHDVRHLRQLLEELEAEG